MKTIEEIIKDLRFLTTEMRDAAEGHYCQTYNRERGKAFVDVADMLDEYLNSLEKSIMCPENEPRRP